MLPKKAARRVLHQLGGLGVLRSRHRRKFRVLMFHSFYERDRANMEAICAYITRHFEPVSLSAIVDALDGRKPLPDNAITITVDDGYRNFLLHGYPMFRKHRIPATLYSVAGFADAKLWLWTDQIEFGLRHTARSSIRTSLADGIAAELSLRTPEEKATAIMSLTESLKEVSNDRRLAFLADFAGLCGVEIPPHPPAGCEAMSWDELRAVAADGVEIGCHTQTHPILSRLTDRAEVESEIRGARQYMEERLGFEVRHFCYPNGRPIDVGETAMRCVQEAGFTSAVSCSYGLNTLAADRFQILRIPFRGDLDLHYGKELLAGLHM